MKNVKIFLLALIAGSAVMTSCNKDNEEPLITGLTYSGTPYADSVITITATISDAEGLSSVTLKEITGGATVGSEIWSTTLEGGSYSLSYDYTIGSTANAGDEIQIEVVVVDDHKKDDLVNTISSKVSFDVEALPNPSTPLLSYTAKLLGGQSNPNAGSFLNMDNGQILLTAAADAAQADVDLIFAYGSSSLYYIAAPNDGNIEISHTSVASWTTRNATKLKATTFTATEFDAMTDDSDFQYIGTLSDTKVTALAAGNVFAFETVSGLLGLAKVVSVDDGTGGASAREIVLDIKYR